MISFLRRTLSSWAVLALLGLVLIAFVVTGVQDPFGGGGGSASALARAGDLRVTAPEFEQQWRRLNESLRERDPSYTPERAAREGAVEDVVDQLIEAKALEAFARDQGLAAGDPLVDAEIRSVPAFQFGGRFSQSAYEQALRGQGLSDREVRASLAGDLLRRQLVGPVGAGASAPAGVGEAYARVLLEGRRGLIGVVPADAAARQVPAPTDADLARFYGERRARFTTPERRVFRYAVLTPAVTPPAEADIAEYYARNAARFGAVERRALRQVVLPDEAAARRLAAAARDAGGFAAAAQAQGFAPADTALGEVTRDALARATSPAVAAAAFAAPARGLAAVARSDFGWHVVAVDAVAGGQTRPLAQVRGEIAATLGRERAEAAAAALADDVQRAVGDGAGFAELARRFRLAPVTTPPLDRSGTGPDGAATNPTLRLLVTAAFGSEPGDDPSVEDLSEGRAALFQLVDVMPSAVPPLARVRAQVAAAWTAERRGAAAAALAASIAREVSNGRPLAAALAARGLAPPRPAAARRVDLARPGAQVPPPLLALFDLPPGGARALPAGAAGAYVAQAVAVVPPDPALARALTGDLRRQLSETGAAELTRAFARATESEVGVRRNDAAVGRLRARLAGAAEPAS